jgi:hypothetical protein
VVVIPTYLIAADEDVRAALDLAAGSAPKATAPCL